MHIRNKFNKLFRMIFSHLPEMKVITFESKPMFSDNSYAVYDYMVKNGYNEKYRLVWFNDNEKEVSICEYPNCCIINSNSLIGKIIKIYYCERAYINISSNYFIYSTRKNHRNIHLGHGVGIKDTKQFMFLNEYVDDVIVQAKYFVQDAKKAYSVPESIIQPLGYPRSDFLLNRDDNLRKRLNIKSNVKIIVWLPTFRSTTKGSRVETSREYIYGLPIFQRKEDLFELNKYLDKKNTIIYIKNHFAQDDVGDIPVFSRIKFIDNDFLRENKCQLYEFISISDALITDYSTVYFEYLLTQKPIGLTVDDLDDYKKGRGLVIKDYYESIKGFYINNYNDLIRFVDLEDRDTLLKSMEYQISKYNDYCDGKSANRVVDFLKRKYRL